MSYYGGYNQDNIANEQDTTVMFKLGLSIIFLSALAFWGMVPPQSILADGKEPIILSTSIENRFPEGIFFAVETTSPAGIEEIRMDFQSCNNSFTTYNYLEFDQGISVKGTFLLRTQGGAPGNSNHIPPGTMLCYSFTIVDTVGQSLKTPEQKFLYTDARFEWESVSKDTVIVYFYGPVKKRAEIVLEAALHTINRMRSLFGIVPKEPIRILVYNNERHMAPALPFRSKTIEAFLRTLGLAWPEHRVIIALGFEPNVRGTISHEITHILLGEAVGRFRNLVPRWLDEGLAEFANLEDNDVYNRALEYAVFTRRLKPLRFLERFPGDPQEILLAYGQSHAVVNFLVETYGPDKFAHLLRYIAKGLPIDKALTEAYGFDQSQLDNQWRRSLGLKSLPSPSDLDSDPPKASTTPTSRAPSPSDPMDKDNSTAVPPRKTIFPGCNINSQSEDNGDSSPRNLAMPILLTGPFLGLGLIRIWRRNR